jgi:hypothetical protein
VRRLAFVIVVVIAAGCGGGDGGNFADDARARCAQARAEAKKLGGAVNAARLAQVMEQRNTIIRELIGDLSELEPPDEQQSDFERMLGYYTQALGTQERVPHLLVDGDLAQARSLLAQAEVLAAKGDGVAKRLGLGACAQTA